MRIKGLEQEITHLANQNNELHNEIMLLKNKSVSINFTAKSGLNFV